MLASTLMLVALAVPAFSKAPFEGTWEAQMNDQPAIQITLHQNAKKVEGTILFYFQTRGPDGRWRVVENQGAPAPLLKPRLRDGLLTFEVRHHLRHGSPEYGPNKRYTFELSGANEARLKEVGAADPGAGMKLNRR